MILQRTCLRSHSSLGIGKALTCLVQGAARNWLCDPPLACAALDRQRAGTPCCGLPRASDFSDGPNDAAFEGAGLESARYGVRAVIPATAWAEPPDTRNTSGDRLSHHSCRLPNHLRRPLRAALDTLSLEAAGSAMGRITAGNVLLGSDGDAFGCGHASAKWAIPRPQVDGSSRVVVRAPAEGAHETRRRARG